MQQSADCRGLASLALFRSAAADAQRYTATHSCSDLTVSDYQLSLAVVWADIDLLEIELSVSFMAWSGLERSYVTRDDLTSFAASLDEVVAGSTAAEFSAGQPDLGYGSCRVFEYDRARRLGMEVVVGHAGGNVVNRPDYPRELRVSVPIERGQLSVFASRLRQLVASERGTASLPILSDWPW